MLNNLAKKLIKFYWKYRWYEGTKWLNRIRPIFLSEAKEFLFERKLIKDDQSIESLAKKWPLYVQKLFNPSSSEIFYSNWKGEVGASNIIANILDQFSRPYIPSILIDKFGRNNQFTDKLLDFGCGTAAISLSWQRSFANNSTLLLADVENLPREFVRYRIKKYPKLMVKLVDVDLNGIKDNSIDVILCVHVLEHLPDPTSILKLLDHKLKRGGILILEAPWGGHPEHLKEAQINWYNNGGKNLLDTKYILLKKMNLFIPLSGVYKKK